jgi:Flp pilus assembly CpaE family ATPase
MASKNIVDILHRVDIFENLAEPELERIGDMLTERRYREGQTLFKHGDVGDALLIVADGRVKVFISEGQSERVLAFFGTGDVLGEMALLTGEPRSASASAISDTHVLALSKSDFDTYLATNVSVMREMMRIIALRQAQTNVRLTRGGDEQAETSPGAGRVYTIFGPRGGSGKTTVAVNLAVSYAQMHPDRVSLLDLSLTFGHCALMLNLMPKSSLSSMTMDTLSRIDRENLENYVVTHPSTLKILEGATKPEDGEAVTGEHAKLAIEAMRRYNEVTVIDTSSTFTDATIAALEAADKVILVCTPELTTLRDIRECQRIFTSVIRVSKDKLFYLLNNPGPFKALPNEQFEQALTRRVDVEMPFGQDLPTRAATRGEALVQVHPGTDIARAIDRVAKLLEEEATPTTKHAERRGISGLFNRG